MCRAAKSFHWPIDPADKFADSADIGRLIKKSCSFKRFTDDAAKSFHWPIDPADKFADSADSKFMKSIPIINHVLSGFLLCKLTFTILSNVALGSVRYWMVNR